VKVKLTDIPVYYINLDSETEKRKRLENTLEELGWTTVTRYPGVERPNRKAGCAESHHKLLMELQHKPTPFIVLEDDIAPHHFKRFVNIPEHADAFYLGLSRFGLYNGTGTRKISAEKRTPNVYRLYNMLAAHAIMYLNQDYVKWLVRAIRFPRSVNTNQDKARADTMKYWNIYGHSPALFYQRGHNVKHTKITLPINSMGRAGDAW
jgi:GR25 family glycosyltransferase involved in LPS biosynthesis